MFHPLTIADACRAPSSISRTVLEYHAMESRFADGREFR